MVLPYLPKALITGGNSSTEKAILSVMEAQIRGVLTNEMTSVYLRTTVTPNQISNLIWCRNGNIPCYCTISMRFKMR